MRQFIVGLALGATITGTGAIAVELAGDDNPLRHLPVQTQIDRIIQGTHMAFEDVDEAFTKVGAIFADIDRRLTALEAKK